MATKILPHDRRDPDYLRFLATYSFEQYLADGRIGPLEAWRRQKKGGC